MGRRRYIDWARGLAVLCMIEHHTTDAFLQTDLKDGTWGRLFRFLGGVAAPGFLFLAGLAIAFTLERAAARGAPVGELVRKGARRGLGILVAAYVFRVQEWALAWPWSPAKDMLRVDVLNAIGLSLIAVALLWGTRRAVVFTIACAAVIAVTPLLWDANLGHSLLARYVSGRPPQDLFPVFPWVAHALIGAAIGLVLARTDREREGRTILWLTAGAVAASCLALLSDRGAVHDWRWWNIAPAYFTLRTASNLGILVGCWLLERVWTPAFADPLLKLGQHSLAVYWVHVELVYGRWFWRARGVQPLGKTALALVYVIGSMIALAYLIEPAKAAWKSRPRFAMEPSP